MFLTGDPFKIMSGTIIGILANDDEVVVKRQLFSIPQVFIYLQSYSDGSQRVGSALDPICGCELRK